MLRVLVPVDGSSNSVRAVQHALTQFISGQPMEIHFLHVRTPLPQHAARFLNRDCRAAYHQDEAEKALKPAREVLGRYGVPYTVHVEFGDKARTIDRVARRLHVSQIVMGTSRKNSFMRMIEDSVTNRVLELAQVPVEVIAGESISKLERYLVPAGAGGAALALILLAAD
ncbi:MAG: universal stress protein [Betaproteobacteria bacterium]|nr:universal stress protein [Betaproteobacteria bacterium]